MISPQQFTAKMMPAVVQAATVVRRLEGSVENRPKCDETTPIKAALTASDTVAQEVILESLLEHFPQVTLAAEEDTPGVARFPAQGDSLVIIDPIDGTLNSYLHGKGPYAIMVGLVNQGQYEAALIGLPREGIFYEAYRGGGARVSCAGGEARVARSDDRSSEVMVSYDLPIEVADRLQSLGYELRFGCGGAIALGPLLPGICGGLRVPRSAPEISIRGKIGALISSEAGMLLRRENSKDFPLVLDTPAKALLVASDEKTLGDLEYALSALSLG